MGAGNFWKNRGNGEWWLKIIKYYRNPKLKNEFGIFVYQSKRFSVLKFFVFPEYSPLVCVYYAQNTRTLRTMPPSVNLHKQQRPGQYVNCADLTNLPKKAKSAKKSLAFHFRLWYSLTVDRTRPQTKRKGDTTE